MLEDFGKINMKSCVVLLMMHVSLKCIPCIYHEIQRKTDIKDTFLLQYFLLNYTLKCTHTHTEKCINRYRVCSIRYIRCRRFSIYVISFVCLHLHIHTTTDTNMNCMLSICTFFSWFYFVWNRKC